MAGLGPGASPGGASCELCAAQKQPGAAAAWSCLTCLSSFCGTHALPHRSGGDGVGAAFRGHRVLPAGEAARELRALRDRAQRCGHHVGRPLELFCEDCALCVCALCPALGPHRGHRVELVPQAARGKQAIMTSYLKQLTAKKDQEVENTKHIAEAANELKVHMSASKTWLTGKFAELRLLFDEEEALTKRYIEEKGQQTLKEYEEQMEASKKQIRITESFSDRIRQIQLRPDPLYLLKDYATIQKEIAKQRVPAEQWFAAPLSFEQLANHFRHFLEIIQSTLQKPLETRLKEDVFCSLDATLKKKPGVLMKVTSGIDRSLFLKHARTPTLAFDSLHPRLTLSEDLLSVSYSWRWKFYASSPQRFDNLWQVLSRDSFYAGSHYWEVDLVQAGQGWWIGAAYSSLKRKGNSELCRLGWNRESWCIKRFDFEYWAFHNGEKIPVRTEDDPERIGVFLDYEAGLLSFYNVTVGMAHLHTFRSKFTEPVYPALRLWEGTITIRTLT
ncbi:tripartite motif-containing protein 14 [Sphaerodactylus townsendi]|uniref:tripartite motif-containing protein 14 n=1 Tax=Sphaerodactylus townsendi TaxID=933632 RepID=UPI002025F550|nr:tripartite motif-containing protein 14 [Sphaerodactylus townsendi]